MSQPLPASGHQLPPGGITNRMGVLFMRLLASLPLSWVRALGWVLGQA